MEESAATNEPASAQQEQAQTRPPGRIGPAIIVGLTLGILSIIAVAMVVLALTMPRWEPPAEQSGPVGRPTPFEHPLRVVLARDLDGERERPEHIDHRAELLQVRLYHADSIRLRNFRVELRIVESSRHVEPHELEDNDHNNDNHTLNDEVTPTIEIGETLIGVEALSMSDGGLSLELTPLNMPIRALDSGQRIATVWAVLPYKRHELSEGTALISDILTATIVEVEPPLSTEPGDYARTDFTID